MDPLDPPVFVAGCHKCLGGWPRRRCRERHWLIDLDGFGEHIVPAATKAKARYEDFRLAREAGHFSGRHGFHEFLVRLGRVVEVSHLGPSV